MLQRLRGNNTKGFTLIELMIVIAIIGILAAIAIPNFISYRNKSFCSSAESDANAIAGALSDYFAIPTRTTMPAIDGDLGNPVSGGNVGTFIGTDPNAAITIQVTDSSGRCPDDYQSAMDSTNNPRGYWDGSNNYIKIMSVN